MKYFLGMNLLTHDVTFYLLDENADLVFAIEEERIVRSRYFTTCSYFALEYMLGACGIDKKDIAGLGLCLSMSEYEKMFERHKELYGTEMAARHENYIRRLFQYRYNLIDSIKLPDAKVVEVPHHLCHAISSFSLSPFDSAAVIAIDGNGEKDTLVIYHATGEGMVRKASVERPHSIGWIWKAVTTKWLRLGIPGNEGKTMGLAAHGRPIYKDKFYEGFDTKLGKLPIFKVDWDTGLFESPAMKELYGKTITEEEIFGESPAYDTIPGEYQRDIAASLQEVTNEIFLALARYAKRITGEKNLVLCGGVAMNSVSNGVVGRSGIFENVFVPPNASDNGVGLGSALYVLNSMCGKKLHKVNCKLPYTSCEYREDQIVQALKEFDLPLNKMEDPIKETADELMKESIIGWFQGKMELGARALGNRSILTLPYPYEMKNRVNMKVKFREYWRPFAPVIKEESFSEWFESNATREPYMTSTQPFKKGMGKRVPAVLHDDGTGRVQTCSKDDNKMLYDLLSAVEKRNSIPILLNTSFNIKGMPIVASPEDAVLCFLCTDIDALVIGDYIVRKKDHAYNRVSLLKVSHASRFIDITLKKGDNPLFITDGSDLEKKQISKILKETLNKEKVPYKVVSCHQDIDNADRITKAYLIYSGGDVVSDAFIEKMKPKLEFVYPLIQEKEIDCYALDLGGASFVLNHLLSRKNWKEIISGKHPEAVFIGQPKWRDTEAK